MSYFQKSAGRRLLRQILRPGLRPPRSAPCRGIHPVLRQVFRPAVGLAVALLLAGGCDAPGGGDEPGDTPQRGGTAVIAAATDLQAATPLTVTEAWTRDFFTNALFLPLVRAAEEGGYEPVLAESWDLEGDTVVVFRLLPGVRWHDGAATTAEDVAFTFRRATDPETGFANPGFFSEWSDPEVVDSLTIRFRIADQLDPLLGWAETGIVPRHLLEEVPASGMRQAAFNQAPVGNGPFRFVSRTSNDRWIFEANPAHPSELGGPPHLDRLVWRVIPESDAQVTELLTGGAHLITGPRADQLERLEDRDGVRAIIRPSRKYTFIGWNGRIEPLGDPRVRLALSHAMDRERMLRATRGGHGTLGSTPVPPSHFAHDSTLPPLAFDTARARALLDEAGLVDSDDDGTRELPDGSDFTIELKIPANNAFNRDVAELVRADLDRVGVPVTTRTTEATTLIGDITSPERRFEAVLMALEADISLDLRPLFHSGAADGPFQIAGYGDPEVDDLLDRIADTTDPAASAELWQQLQRRLREDQPWTILWFNPDLFVARDELRGIEMDVRGAFLSMPDWWLAGQDTAALAGRGTGASTGS